MQKINHLFSFLILLLLLGSCKKSHTLKDPLVPKTVDQDSSLPSIMINNRMLHAEAFGNPNNTIIICIHGGPGGDYKYMLNAKHLANQGYRVVFYDQVGSGLSQRFNEDYYENLDVNGIFLNELKGVINHYKSNANQKVVLLGHSWGAMLATAYAGKYPSEISGLILMEPGGLEWNDIVDYIVRTQIPDTTPREQPNEADKNNHDLLDYKMGLLTAMNNPITREAGNTGGSWRSGAVINSVAVRQGEKEQVNMAAGIENFSSPVLFVYGDNQGYPDYWAEKISSVFKNKELCKVLGVGHSGMLTENEVWNDKMQPKTLSYLKRPGMEK